MSISTFYRSPVFVAIGVFLATLAVYLVTMPQGITFEDAGLFQMICHEGGIGHPPGYPLFILSCQAFVSLPFFDQSVFAANFLSALYASAACAVMYLLIADWTGRPGLALLAALVYGLSTTFWSQSVIVEVYSLSALMFLLCLWICVKYVQLRTPGMLVLLAFFYGLGLSNHWPLLGLATPALLILLWPAREAFLAHLFSRWLPGCLFALMLGLSPYLSLLQSEPRYAVFGEVSSVQEFIKYVTRAAYSDQFPLSDWSDKSKYQRWIWMRTLLEFSFVLAPLTIIGLYRSFLDLKLTDALALVALYLGGTTMLVLMLGFEFSDVRIAIFEPYPIVAYIAAAIWTALGGVFLANVIRQHSAAIANVIPVAMVLAVGVANFSKNDRSGNRFAEIYGLELLSLIPADAVLFVEGDNGVGLLGYLHYVAGYRPDLELRSWNNLVFGNRLTSPFLPVEQQQAVRDEFIHEQTRPVLSTVSPYRHGARAGLVIRHNFPHQYICPDGTHEFVDYLLQLYHSGRLANGHERDFLASLLVEYTRLHAGLVTTQKDVDESELVILRRLQSTFYGKISMVEMFLQIPQSEHEHYSMSKQKLESLINEAEASMPEYPSRALRGVIAEYQGRVALLEPADRDAAVQYFRASLVAHSSSENTSLCALYKTYVDLEETNNATAVLEKWGRQCGG